MMVFVSPPPPQHFREHLDKLFAQGIGMLDLALTEAFSLLGDVSITLTDDFYKAYMHIHAYMKCDSYQCLLN